MDEPLVYLLSYQWHRRVATFVMDKRWKHISAKPILRLDFPFFRTEDSQKNIGLIGRRCKCSNVFSRAILSSRETWLLFVLFISNKQYFYIHYIQHNFYGNYSAEDPPDPIPNSEVKLCCADGTTRATSVEE